MSTVYKRLKALGFTLTPQQRQDIGQIVRDQFFATPLKSKYFKKVDQKEGTETFQVLYYDTRFTPRIDQLIEFYAEHHQIPRRTRPVITRKQPEKPPSSPHPQKVVTPQTPVRTPRKRTPIKSSKPSQLIISAKPNKDQSNG